MSRKSSLKLPLQYRRHALARLDAVIAVAEQDRAEHVAAVERLSAAEAGSPRANCRKLWMAKHPADGFSWVSA